jgi:hypothetical protein
MKREKDRWVRTPMSTREREREREREGGGERGERERESHIMYNNLRHKEENNFFSLHTFSQINSISFFSRVSHASALDKRAFTSIESFSFPPA